MTADPRLTSTALLTLAAFRVRERRQHEIPDWRQSEGISALLAAAKALPRRDVDLEASDTGMGRLLKKARQWHQEHRHGA